MSRAGKNASLHVYYGFTKFDEQRAVNEKVCFVSLSYTQTHCQTPTHTHTCARAHTHQ